MVKSALLYLYQKWAAFAKKVGQWQITLLFSLLYYLLICPLGRIVQLFTDFLSNNKARGWEKAEEELNLEGMKKQ